MQFKLLLHIPAALNPRFSLCDSLCVVCRVSCAVCRRVSLGQEAHLSPSRCCACPGSWRTGVEAHIAITSGRPRQRGELAGSVWWCLSWWIHWISLQRGLIQTGLPPLCCCCCAGTPTLARAGPLAQALAAQSRCQRNVPCQASSQGRLRACLLVQIPRLWLSLCSHSAPHCRLLTRRT